MNKTAFGAPKRSRIVEKPQDDQDLLAGYEMGDTIGSFYGNLRRSKVKKGGLIAQIFGENGKEADFISILHYTRFLDALVKVSVWLVKDANGKSFLQDGQHPLLAEFIATIQRPSPSDFGQTAQFLGTDGANADAINQLNESRLLDALVLVEIQKAEPGFSADDIPTIVDQKMLNEGVNRLTAAETAKLKKEQKKADTAIQILRQSRFFQNENVLFVLGKPSLYKEWLHSQTCCHPMPIGEPACHQGPAVPLPVTSGKLKNFNFVPMCPHHHELWLQDDLPETGGSGPLKFLESQNYIYVNRWAIERLNQVLNVPAGYLPSPSLIYNWVIDNKLKSILPSNFELQFIN